MNRYAATGLLLEAMGARAVLVLSGTHVEKRIAHRALQTVAQDMDLPVTIVNVVGREAVHTPRGTVCFDVLDHRIADRLANAQYDVVFLDHDAVEALRYGESRSVAMVRTCLERATSARPDAVVQA